MPNYKSNLFKGISFSYLYIFVYLVTGVLTTPILLHSFQADYFALLMLVYSIITYLNNIRFGIPESIAAVLAKTKDKRLKFELIKKSLVLLVLLVLLAFGLIFVANFFIEDWRIILGDVYHLNKEDVENVFYILVLFALLKIPLELSLSVFIGLHEVYLEKIYKIFNILSIFILVLIVYILDIDIVSFVIFAGSLDLFVSAIAFIHLIVRHRVFSRVEREKVDSNPPILNRAFLFFQVSMTQTILWGSGILIISHFLSITDVTIYSLTMKIYIYIYYTFVIINTVLAPQYGKYFSNSSWNKIENLFTLMLFILPFLSGFIWIGTLLFMKTIISLWSGFDYYFIGYGYVFFMGAFFYFTGYVNSYITLLYSIDETKSVVSIRWREVMLNILLSISLVHFIGIIGIAISMSVSILLTSIRYFPLEVKNRSLGKLKIDFRRHKEHFFRVLLPIALSSLLFAVYIDSLLMKFLFFILISLYYIKLSWLMLTIKEKESIIVFLKRR